MTMKIRKLWGRLRRPANELKKEKIAFHVVFWALKGPGYNPNTMEPLTDHWAIHDTEEAAKEYYERVQDIRNFHSGGYAPIKEGSDWF
jgi:hypothetical protein|tara:strand:+ start:3012 stop:3275 length:264 start_codon:yes stop_codon:yes gene_type:complete